MLRFSSHFTLCFFVFAQYQASILEKKLRSVALSWDSEQLSVDWETWVPPVFQDRNFLWRLTRNLLVSANPEFAIDSESWDSTLVAQTIHQFLLVMFGLLLRNNFLQILEFLANLSPNFLGRVYSLFPILLSCIFCFFVPDQPIDSLVVAVIVGT